MSLPELPADETTELPIVCLFLAHSGSPSEELGFSKQKQAFEEIGRLFGVPPNAVKGLRDEFDAHTDSERIGWVRDLRAPLKEVFDKYGSFNRAELKELVNRLIHRRQQMQSLEDGLCDIFSMIVSETDAPTKVRQPIEALAVAFSNTGRRSDGWFVLTLDQIAQALEDLAVKSARVISEAGNPADYDEARWRRIFEDCLSDEVAKTMGKVQTLPLFELLGKIVHFANKTGPRSFRQLSVDADELRIAKDRLLEWKTQRQEANLPDEEGKEEERLRGGENVILYGAPGTGKSHKIDKQLRGHRAIRTVFHPDLQNSDFFGSLKPRMEGGDVCYEFSPGPFMLALAEAQSNPGKPVYLIIEELNRAAAAAVFGDLFLLLDRDDEGKGEYDVDFPSAESRIWFGHAVGGAYGKLRLPSNLFIYATMNSADQGVFPVDTAFRRRWRQEYIPLDYSSAPDGRVSFTGSDDRQRHVEWRDFVKVLNNHLASDIELDIPEDRLIGQWFVKSNELNGHGIPQKVLLYLWDDLLRHAGRAIIFDMTKVTTFGSLAQLSDRKECFLSVALLEKLEMLTEAAPSSPDEVTELPNAD